jgi:hypothetical protein
MQTISSFRLIFALLYMIGQALFFSWPVTLTLLGILFSELPHAPKNWQKQHLVAFVPLLISKLLVLYVVAAICIPPLRFISLGLLTGQLAMVAEIAAAGYALYRLEGHRCFFLSLLLVELWIGFWTTSIAGMILMYLKYAVR